MTNTANVKFSKGKIEIRVGGWGQDLTPLKLDNATAAIVSNTYRSLIPSLNEALSRAQVEPGETVYTTSVTEQIGGKGATVSFTISLNVLVSEHVPALLLDKDISVARAALVKQLVGDIDDELVLSLLGLDEVLNGIKDLIGADLPASGPETDYASPYADNF